MKIDIQAVHVTVTEELSESIKSKVNKLAHFYEDIVDARVYLHEENSHKNIELKLMVKDTTLFVKESGDSFSAALDKSIDTMKRQIVKYKEKTLKN